MKCRALIAILITLALLLAGVGCASDRVDLPTTPVSPGDAAVKPPQPRKPFYVTVADLREHMGPGMKWPEPLVVSGQTILAGQGDVVVNLTLYKGATLEPLKPFIEITPATVTYNTADWDKEFKVQLRWDPKKPEQKAQRMTFRLKKGAPLGAGQTLADDFTVTIERRPEALFSVKTMGHDEIRSPYPSYRGHSYLAPGRYTFRMEFTKDIDRATVEQAVSDTFQKCYRDGLSTPAKPQVTWVDSRTLDIVAELGSDGLYVISANGARDSDGMTVLADGQLTLATESPETLYEVPLVAPETARALMTLQPGHSAEAISGDGKRVLAVENPGSPGDDDGPSMLLPWLYRDGAKVKSLYESLGFAQAIGFRTDGGLWLSANYELHTRATPDGQLISHKAYDHSPSGWAVSGDGKTVVYFDRSAGYEDEYYTTDPVWLDLFVYHPDTGETKRFERVARMPANLDFYGPGLNLAVDNTGGTAAFVDRSEAQARVARIDLATGTIRRLVQVMDYSQITISPDGKFVAVTLSDRQDWGLVALQSGAVRNLIVEGQKAQFSPDGTKLAVMLLGTVRVVDVSTGSISDLGSGNLVGWAADSTKVFLARMAK